MGYRFDRHVHKLPLSGAFALASSTLRAKQHPRAGELGYRRHRHDGPRHRCLDGGDHLCRTTDRQQVVYTAGDTVTYEQLADIVDSVLGRKLLREEWSVPLLKDDLAKDPSNPIKKYRVVVRRGTGSLVGCRQRTFNARAAELRSSVSSSGHART